MVSLLIVCITVLMLDASFAHKSLTPENPVDGNVTLSMIANDNNEMIDGVYQCNNDDFNSLCAKLELPSLKCETTEFEIIKITIHAEKVDGNGNLVTIASKGQDYFAILNDYTDPSVANPVDVRRRALIESGPRGINGGGDFMTPRCNSSHLHKIDGVDIENIWDDVDTSGSEYLDNRRVLSNGNMDDWTRITRDNHHDKYIDRDRTSINDPITIIMLIRNYDLFVALESETVYEPCDYNKTSFDVSDDSPYKILFATDSGTINMHRFDIKHSCRPVKGPE